MHFILYSLAIILINSLFSEKDYIYFRKKKNDCLLSIQIGKKHLLSVVVGFRT